MEAFKRCWRLQIQIGDSVKTYEELKLDDTSLKIDFDITNGIYGAFANGNITIHNLSFKDAEYLASCVSPFGKFKRNKISLEAGYYGNLGVLINGNIIECDADFNNSDIKITLKITGRIGNNLLNNNITASFNNKVEFKNICEKCAELNDLILFYDKKISKRFLTDFSFLGSPFQMIEKLRTYFKDLNIFLSENGEVLNVMLKENGEVLNKTELSYKTGLIGRIKPTMLGCNVTSLLNTNFKAGSHVNLKNHILKGYDGIYRINELKHVGSNFSNNWFSYLVLQRIKG